MAEITRINSASPAVAAGGAAPTFHELVHFYGQVLRRGWHLIAISLVVVLTLAGFYLATTTRLYEAKARLLVLQQGGRPVNVANNDPNQSMEQSDDYIPTHTLILSSPSVVDGAIKSVGLERLNTLATAKRQGLDPVAVAIEQLKVERPDRQAKIINVTYRAESKEEAVQTVMALINSYQAFLDKSFENKSSEAVGLITKAKEDLEKDLGLLEEQYRVSRQRNKTLLADGHGRSFASIELEQLYRAANDAKVKAVQLKSQLELGKGLLQGGTGLWAIAHAMEQVGAGPSNTLLVNAAGLSQNASLDYVRQLGEEQQKLVDRFGPQNARVQEIRDQIERTQKEARDVRHRLEQGDTRDLLTSVQSSLKATEDLRAELKSEFERSLEEAKKIENDLLEESNLRDKIERQRSLFNSVVAQLKQADFVKDYRTMIAEVLEPPNARARPVSPRMSLILGIAFLLAVLIGVGAAVAAEHLDQQIRTLEEIRGIFNMPTLGLIPQLPEEQLAKIRSPGLVAHTDPQSIWAESYRSIRTNLDFLRRTKNVQVILLTSPCSGDGKTTTASNLASIIAHTGRKVLLIDADLRKPSQHKIHNLEIERGLSQVLGQLLPFRSVVQRSVVENLDVLTAGAYVPNPAERLASDQFAEFIQEVRKLYDIVIVDSPPVLAVTDSSIISGVVDGVVVVVSATNLKRFDAERTAEAVSSMGVPILGLVLNGISRDWFAGSRGYGYGYGYGYGSEGHARTSHDDEDPRPGLVPITDRNPGDENPSPGHHRMNGHTNE